MILWGAPVPDWQGMARLGAARLARARLWGSVDLEHQAAHIQPVPEHGLGTLLPP